MIKKKFHQFIHINKDNEFEAFEELNTLNNKINEHSNMDIEKDMIKKDSSEELVNQNTNKDNIPFSSEPNKMIKKRVKPGKKNFLQKL